MRSLTESGTGRSTAVLEVTVRNHPGVMVHVCSLFTRRTYNMEGILCLPTGGGTESRILILVNEDGRLEQVHKQLQKLEDVRRVIRRRPTRDVFDTLGALFEAN